jgi:hypothetical protein
MKKLHQRRTFGSCRRLALIEKTGGISTPDKMVSSIDLEWIEDRLHRLREGYEWI